jgi:hypothetical protein
MIETPGLSLIESVWRLAWNIADGEWGRIGLEEAGARKLLLAQFSKLHGDLLGAAKVSRGRLQQCLMALRRGTFEEIQQDSPFSLHARRNMDTLLRAWMEEGEAGFARVWAEVFRPGWQAARETHPPIQIIEDIGDCEERALEVRGALDGETRVAAEWWYLYYMFGRDWKPGMHFTAIAKEEGTHFSVHNITVLPDTRKRVYFRLPW